MIFGASRPRRSSNPPRASRRSDAGLPPEELPPKLIPTLRLLGSTVGSLVHTRLALAGIELEEELQRLISAVAFALIALVLVFLAMVVATFTIVVAVAPEHRVATMIGITVVYVIGAVVLLLRIKGIFTNRPPIFAATLAELAKDKETLAQMARAHDSADEVRERTMRSDEDAFAPLSPSPSTARSQGAL